MSIPMTVITLNLPMCKKLYSLNKNKRQSSMPFFDPKMIFNQLRDEK